MKTKLFRITAVVFTLAILFFATVIPAGAKTTGATVEFAGIQFIPFKGYVFKFNVHGTMKNKDLKGSVKIGHKIYDLSCGYNDDGDINCSTTANLRQYIGRSVSGAVAGVAFTDTVPQAYSLHCAFIYDYDPNYYNWGIIGKYCARSLPSTIDYYNPAYSDNFYYYYYNDGSDVTCPNPPAPNWGPGYYYDDPDYCS